MCLDVLALVAACDPTFPWGGELRVLAAQPWLESYATCDPMLPSGEALRVLKALQPVLKALQPVPKALQPWSKFRVTLSAEWLLEVPALRVLGFVPPCKQPSVDREPLASLGSCYGYSVEGPRGSLRPGGACSWPEADETTRFSPQHLPTPSVPLGGLGHGPWMRMGQVLEGVTDGSPGLVACSFPRMNGV